jgi:hypothetical protein
MIWINGAFGAGKTTLAKELHERLPEALAFDPEDVGHILAQWVPSPPSGDFQDIPLWRKLVAEFAIGMSAEYGTTLSQGPLPSGRFTHRAGLLLSRSAPVVDSGLALARTWSEGLEPGVQEAEFVAFRVGQAVPALGAGLADVGGPGAESEQPLQLRVLVAVGGVDVDVESELPAPRIAARAEDQGGLRAAEADVGRPDLDASVVLPAEFDVAEDLAPECGEPVGVGGVDDQLADAACHARKCT